jgi:hypothetical protein
MNFAYERSASMKLGSVSSLLLKLAKGSLARVNETDEIGLVLARVKLLDDRSAFEKLAS